MSPLIAMITPCLLMWISGNVMEPSVKNTIVGIQNATYILVKTMDMRTIFITVQSSVERIVLLPILEMVSVMMIVTTSNVILILLVGTPIVTA